MFNLPQITSEQLDEFLDEIEGLRSAAEYLNERAERGSRSKFEAALAKVADHEPEEADRL